MNPKKLVLFLSLLCLPVLAAPRRVPVADAALVTGLHSSPEQLTRVGAQVFFTATDGIHGFELWRTDGTAAGTRMVKDIAVGSESPGLYFAGTLGNALLFRTGTNAALWRSDGTADGTYRLFPFPPAVQPNGGFHAGVYAADTRAFVIVQQRSGEPKELWVVDGTPDSARRLGIYDIQGTPLGANGKFYFTATDATVGLQFWVSDGTPPGTHMLSRATQCPGFAACGPLPRDLFRIGTTMFFLTANGLWRTDGTQQGTIEIAHVPDPRFVGTSSTFAWFTSGGKLWRTDGTAATQGPAEPAQTTSKRVLEDGRLVYSVGDTFWKTDGQTKTQLATVQNRYGTDAIGVIGSRLFLAAQPSNAGVELWSLDADTGATALVKDIDPRVLVGGAASSNPGPGATLGTKLFFPATDFRGTELWETDGTADGTKLVVNIRAEENGGVVSGLVTDKDTALPLPQARVSICDSSACSTIVAGNDGRYRFDGVKAGTYTVRATSFYYLTAAAQATVTAGFETQGVDLAVPRGGTIGGRVTRLATGEPLYRAQVTIYNSAGTMVDRVLAAPDGMYRSRGLGTGTYHLETFIIYDQGVMNQAYGGVECAPSECHWSASTPVSVTLGSDTTGIDFALHDYGKISGTIVDPSTGDPLAGVSVDFTPASAPHYVGATVTTDANGVYTSLFLVPGTYHVAARKTNYGHVAHPDIACTTQPCDYTNATQVPVTIHTTTPGIDFELPPAEAQLSGVITSSDGAPVGNVEVQLLNANGYPGHGLAQTDAHGRYAIDHMLPGTYYVRVHDEVVPNIDCPSSPCNLTGATAVVLEHGTTKKLDAQILARRSVISGRVLDANGNPLANSVVSFHTPAKPFITPLSGSMQNGVYTYTLLSRETGYYVTAYAPGYKRTAYPSGRVVCPNQCTLPDTAVLLSAGTHEGIDITPPPYGKIRGTVTDATTGKALLASVVVQFVSTTDPSRSGYAQTTSGGQYEFGEADGSYYVYAGGGTHYRGQVWPNRDCNGSCVPSNGDVVSVPDGGTVTGIDFNLAQSDPSGAISGRVVDHLTGLGMPNVTVSAALDGSFMMFDYTAITDAQGNFTIERPSFRPLRTGAYRLYASPSNPYFSLVYGGPHCASTNGCSISSGATVQVTAPATTTGIEFRLIRLTITGVSPATGPLAGGTTITVDGTNFTPQTTVSVGGAPATILGRTASQIVARTPAGAAGYAHVAVHAAERQIALVHAFRYVPLVFTDETLVGQWTRVRTIHITELRDAINTLRVSASLAPFPFTDPSLTGMRLRAIHIAEMRTALDQARAALGRPPLSYKNPNMTAGALVRTADIMELRAGVN
ncbi:MAG TPA: carboxypeptidase regulatory-like domain-containing protein [Thermoanaerobaculia bacterium]|nr:carboxypeptidase regulatory-like domain-containing protein [Thermoanaerobaculia bacterium]